MYSTDSTPERQHDFAALEVALAGLRLESCEAALGLARLKLRGSLVAS